jgi:hypothetical protein
MTEIRLPKGYVALVDDEDADLALFAWCAKKARKTFYVQRNIRPDGRRATEFLHQAIARRMGISGQLDHRNRNGLDNRRENIRSATPSQNSANQGIPSNNTSGFSEVTTLAEAAAGFARIGMCVRAALTTPTPTCPTCGGTKRLPSGIARGGTRPCPACDPELAEHYRIMMTRGCPDCGAPAMYSCSNSDPLARHCSGRST